jgi:hypothetical protein
VEWRRFHTTQQDADIPRLGTGDDRPEIAFDLRHRHAVETVVGAKREDQHAGARDHHRLEPPQSIGGGVAAHAGVHDDSVEAAAVELRLQMRGKALPP